MKLPKIKKGSIAASFKTRSFQAGGYSVVATVVVLAIAVVLNILASSLPAKYTQIDTTSTQLFTISEQTESIVEALSKDVTIYWVVQSGSEDATVEKLLDHYESMSSHIRVIKKDPDVYPTFLQNYTSTVSNNSLIVECGERYRYIGYDEIYLYEYDYSSYYYTGSYSYSVSFDGEGALTSAIDYVINEDLPKLYTLTGHGESELSDTYETAVGKENIEIAELSLLTLEAVPEDADAILVLTPQSDISEQEKTMLEEYLGNGGDLFLITDPPQSGSLTNLESLMSRYGVTANEGIVVEGNQNYYAWGTPYYLLPEINSHTITSPLIDSGYYVLLPIAQGLTVSDTDSSISVTKILETSGDAFSKVSGYGLTTYEKEDGDIDGGFALGVAITQTLDDGICSNLVWISSGALVDDQSNTRVSGGNLDLFLNAINWMCEQDESTISIHAKSLDMEYLTIDSGTSGLLTVLMVGLIPLGYLAVGIIIWFRRKHK